jgi:K+-transporting ATPase ATPase C chain
MGRLIRNAISMLLVMTLITGIAYPLIVTGVAQALFPHQANGSLVEKDGKPIGSELIGQSFDDPKYFWGRPSATAPQPYNGTASNGSNQGPTNPALRDAVQQRIDALRKADPDNVAPVPADLVMASGSGLDPDISPASAHYQVARVARVRHLSVTQVQDLVAKFTQGRQLGFLGEPRVNVLQLNLALDGVQNK